MRGRSRIAVASAAAVAVVLSSSFVLGGPAAPARASALEPYEDCASLDARLRADLAWTIEDGALLGGSTQVETRLRLPDATVPASGSLVFTSGDGAIAQSLPKTSGDGVAAVGSGATGTNLQEQDVDEPDIVKLADGRIVALAGDRLVVMSNGRTPVITGSLAIAPGSALWRGSTDTYSAAETSVLSAQSLRELLLIGDRVLVIANGSKLAPAVDARWSNGWALSSSRGEVTPTTRLLLIDVTAAQPRLIEEREQDGVYISSRLVGGKVHVVTASRPAVGGTTYDQVPGGVVPEPRSYDDRAAVIAAQKARVAEADTVNRSLIASAADAAFVPQVRRTDATGTVVENGPAVACTDVSAPSEGRGAGIIAVTTLEPEKGLASVGSRAITAYGDTVYATAERLVVATSAWAEDRPWLGGVDQPRPDVTTQLHTFDLTAEAPTYRSSGSVAGSLLNRWSLSWFQDRLRVATTTWQGDEWDETPSQSSLVVLAEDGADLEVVGRVDGLGRTERITTVRFFGDTAVLVTFRQTDPLYVVDLRADTPVVDGELKITGFSSYLHPLGNDLILGYGSEADQDGLVTGRQVSIFDVSNPALPRIVDRRVISSQVSASPLDEDSRAFAYDPQSRTAYLPLTTGFDEPTQEVMSFAIAADGSLTQGPVLNLATTNDINRVLIDGDALHGVGARGMVSAERASMTVTERTVFPLTEGSGPDQLPLLLD